MKLEKKTAVLIIVGVIIFAAIILYAYLYGPSWPTSPQATGPAPVHALQGQVVAGFPQDLILDSGAQVNNSYSVNYSSSTNQYTVQWNSSSAVARIYNDYLAYFPTHGWTVTNRFTTRPDLRGLYAVNASSSASANVTIAVQGAGSEVSVSYAVTENPMVK
ncbi:MAG: hypothetical protein ABSE18_03040 [Minisyncoccia bacterium]|jgi:hypothetical protein